MVFSRCELASSEEAGLDVPVLPDVECELLFVDDESEGSVRMLL